MLEIAFVMSGINHHESSDMLAVARKYHATHLNIKNVKIIGRAMQFDSMLGFDSKSMLDTYTSLILNWYLSDRSFELEVYIPPSFAEYLNKRFELNLPTTHHSACGGSEIFSYVDLYGNHLPCPSMAYEEKQDTIYNKKVKEINLIDNSISNSFASNVFKDFESDRTNRKYQNQIFPCKYCKYKNQCQPCFAGVIAGGQTETVGICEAIYLTGDDYLAHIKDEIWTGNRASIAQA